MMRRFERVRHWARDGDAMDWELIPPQLIMYFSEKQFQVRQTVADSLEIKTKTVGRFNDSMKLDAV